jgi:hypothetical protein
VIKEKRTVSAGWSCKLKNENIEGTGRKMGKKSSVCTFHLGLPLPPTKEREIW